MNVLPGRRRLTNSRKALGSGAASIRFGDSSAGIMSAAKVFHQHPREGFRRPANQIGDLTVTHLNDPKLAVGSLNYIH